MLELDQVRAQRGPYPMAWNFTLPAGHTLFVTGPSGIGKSTLLDVIGGYWPAQSGRLRWMGQDLSQCPPEQRPVSTLFQDLNLFEHLTVAENLSLALPAQPQRTWREAAEALGIADQLDKPPGALSGGQRQRAGLIAAVLRSEPLLLLDEPFSELDPQTRQRTVDWCLHRFIRQRRTVVLVTHQPEDVLQLQGLPHQILALGTAPARVP